MIEEREDGSSGNVQRIYRIIGSASEYGKYKTCRVGRVIGVSV